MPTLYKTPAEVLDYSFDWDDFWLGDGETISTSEWSVSAENGETPAALIVDSSSNTTSLATVWVSAGTVGVIYRMRNTITSSQGRTAVRTIYLQIKSDLP